MSPPAGFGASFFLGGGSPAPTLVALTTPLVASGNGGGASITLAGTNLTGVTSVKVGSASATGVSSTSTTVTFTPPANTASATPYAVHVTTAGGTATLSNALYSLPTGITAAWYTPQYDSAGGSWTDLVGGVALTAIVPSSMKPTVTSGWANGQPATTYATSNSLSNASAPGAQAQPFSVFAVANATDDSNFEILWASGNASVYCDIYIGSGTYAVSTQAVAGTTTSALMSSTPCLLEAFMNGASSTITQDNGTPAAAAGTGTNGTTGFTIGDYPGGGYGWVGSIGFLAIFAGTPSSGDRSIIHGISQGIYGTP